MNNTKFYKSFFIGDLFSDKINDSFEHHDTIKSVEEIVEGKIEICNCPLCSSERYVNVGKFSIDLLIEKWVNSYDFNPISNFYKGCFLIKRRCLGCGLYFYNYHLPDTSEMYEKLMDKISYYPNFRWEYGLASEFIETLEVENLLEIGSGSGAFLERVKNIVPNVLGSEYNKKAIEVCLKKGLNVSDKDITLIEEKFDVICSFEVLEHIKNTKDFLGNCLKLLKKGGKLIFGVPDPEGILSINGIGALNLPPHHQYDFSRDSFDYIAREYNLKIVEYKRSDLSYRKYERYVQNTTGKVLNEPDISGYLETKKQYTGHSHFVVFEK